MHKYLVGDWVEALPEYLEANPDVVPDCRKPGRVTLLHGVDKYMVMHPNNNESSWPGNLLQPALPPPNRQRPVEPEEEWF